MRTNNIMIPIIASLSTIIGIIPTFLSKEKQEYIRETLKIIKDTVEGLMYGMMDVSILVIGMKMKEQISSQAGALVDTLIERGMRVTTAESCTGGLIAKRITDVSGASEVYMGSCVTYANEAKVKLIGVSKETLRLYGAVSEQTAAEMARGVRKALGTDIGIATTGIAGPGGGTPEKPVGTIYVGISSELGETVTRLRLSPMRSRDYLRMCTSGNALSLALAEILKLTAKKNEKK